MIEGDWSEWRNHVLKELERQNNNMEALAEKFDIYEKTCLQKEGDQKVINARTEMKIYYMDALIGGAAGATIWLIQWWFSSPH
jgi:hypothetical protein